MLNLRQRGDTLIEVLFAVSVFSFVVVGALMLMNQGTAASQRSLEITLVREQIDAQAETLRFLNDSYVATYQSNIEFDTDDSQTSPAEEWYKMAEDIADSGVTAASAFAATTNCPAFPGGSFIMDPRNALYQDAAGSLQSPDTFSQIEYNSGGTFTASRGLWIEAIRSQPSSDEDQANTGYIDFHIRACWEGEGLARPMTLGTIVRLYEPRG